MSRWKPALALIVVILIVILGWRLLRAPGGADAGAKPAADAPVPVTVVVATTQDVPVYLSALGTVQGVLNVFLTFARAAAHPVAVAQLIEHGATDTLAGEGFKLHTLLGFKA